MIDDNLTVLIKRLVRYADDPMWDVHAEVPKILLHEAIAALRSQAEKEDWKSLYEEAERDNKALHAALASYATQSPPTNNTWRPIDTAPRDGTRILAAGGGLEQVEIVSYNERVACWDTETCTLDDRDDEAEGYNRPTKWMPVPSFSREGLSPATEDRT